MGAIDFLQPTGLYPPQGYSHAVVSSGRLVHVAGQVALGLDGALTGKGNLAAQAERAFANLDLALSAADATFASVASLTIYIAAAAPRADLSKLRDPIRRRLGAGPAPAMTLVFVHALMDPDWLVEVQALAVAGEPGAAPPKLAVAN
jgi:enamine deaminase RidA (YjgF/YER057c/UK114 family)